MLSYIMETDKESDSSEPEPKPGKCHADKDTNTMPYGCDVFLPAWVRHYFQTGSRCDKFLLAYNISFLLPISIMLYFILGHNEIGV